MMPTEGTCPVCERAIRVRGGRIVYHGFTRPGRGHIVGDCFGVSYPPYEASCEGTLAYRDKLVLPRLRIARSYLERLERGGVLMLHAEESVPVPTTRERRGFSRTDPGWTVWWFPVERPEAGSPRMGQWMRLFNDALHVTQHEVRSLDGESERCERGNSRMGAGRATRGRRRSPVPGRRRRRRLFSRHA